MPLGISKAMDPPLHKCIRTLIHMILINLFKEFMPVPLI